MLCWLCRPPALMGSFRTTSIGQNAALHNCSPSDKEESPFSTLTVTLSANFK